MSGSTIYARGTLSNIGGQPRNFIAAIEAGTGATTAWNPNGQHAVFALSLAGIRFTLAADSPV